MQQICRDEDLKTTGRADEMENQFYGVGGKREGRGLGGGGIGCEREGRLDRRNERGL
jgi:hypothetical protein